MIVIRINVFNKTDEMLIYFIEMLKFRFSLFSNYLTMLNTGLSLCQFPQGK